MKRTLPKFHVSEVLLWIFFIWNAQYQMFVSQGCKRTETVEELYDKKGLHLERSIPNVCKPRM